MNITLVASFPPRLTISPDPAVVARGEPVIWSLIFADPSAFPKSVQWTIYFGEQHPFGPTAGSSCTQLVEPGFHQYIAGPALEAGEYKYGVRLVDAQSNRRMSDDDPWLIVL